MSNFPVRARALASHLKPAAVGPLTRDTVVDRRPCATCARTFTVTHGERSFAEQAGLPLWDRCKTCRPTRRQLLAQQARRT